MKKLISCSLLILAMLTSTTSCQEEENSAQYNNEVISKNIVAAKEYTVSYYAGIKMRRFKPACNSGIGFCPSSKLMEESFSQYSIMQIDNNTFKVKVTPITDTKVNMNVIVNDGYDAGSVFDITSNYILPVSGNASNIVLIAGSYTITKVGNNEYSINIDAVVN